MRSNCLPVGFQKCFVAPGFPISGRLSVIKYLQQILLSNDSPVRVCLYWNCVLLLRSTSMEFSYCDAMLCCTVYMNQRDLFWRSIWKAESGFYPVLRYLLLFYLRCILSLPGGSQILADGSAKPSVFSYSDCIFSVFS